MTAFTRRSQSKLTHKTFVTSQQPSITQLPGHTTLHRVRDFFIVKFNSESAAFTTVLPIP